MALRDDTLAGDDVPDAGGACAMPSDLPSRLAAREPSELAAGDVAGLLGRTKKGSYGASASSASCDVRSICFRCPK